MEIVSGVHEFITLFMIAPIMLFTFLGLVSLLFRALFGR